MENVLENSKPVKLRLTVFLRVYITFPLGNIYVYFT